MSSHRQGGQWFVEESSDIEILEKKTRLAKVPVTLRDGPHDRIPTT